MARAAIWSSTTLLVLCLQVASIQRAIAATFSGYAAMGASETQGTAYSGSWVPWLAVDRGLNFGPGQSYNRAIGGNDSADLLANGQHTQVANLVSNNQVDLAFLSIGGLDVPPVAFQIAFNQLNVPVWAAGVVGRITTAIDTVMNAGADGMVVMSLPDMALVPASQQYTNGIPILEARISNAVQVVNDLLKQEVLNRGLVFVDAAQALRDMNAAPLVVGGVTIDTTTGDPDPTHFFQDGLHPAVVGNGIFANLFMTALNEGYDHNLALFSDQDLLTKAGLAGSYTGETSTLNYSDYIYFTPVPEPSSLLLLGLSATVLLPIRKRFYKRAG
jgi:hypothetical protein